MDILDTIKEQFKNVSILNKLIFINVSIFVLMRIIQVVFFLMDSNISYNPAVHWLAVPSDLHTLMFRPWTLLTYMFLHEEVMHILFNMLWLFWFGRIFLEYLSERQMLGIYLLGGFSGAVLYILFFNVFPVFAASVAGAIALGASASVVAIVISISVYVPNYKINLFILGPVKIIYIAVISMILDVINIKSSNSGGHIAHIGGAIFGILYVIQYKRGIDIAKGFNRFLDRFITFSKPKSIMRVTYRSERPLTDMEYKAKKNSEQAEIDRILDKISKSGYASLTAEEKEKLFKASK